MKSIRDRFAQSEERPVAEPRIAEVAAGVRSLSHAGAHSQPLELRAAQRAAYGQERFNPEATGLEASGLALYYDALAPRYAALNQRYPITVEVSSKFTTLLRDSLSSSPREREEWMRLQNRTEAVVDRKRRVQKLIEDGINGLPGGEGNLLDAAIREIYHLTPSTPVDTRPTNEVIDIIYANTVGWGPLERLFSDPYVTEISVNSHNNIWAEKSVPGQPAYLERQRVGFGSEAELRAYADRLLQDAQTSKMATADEPTVDLSLPDGSRVNITIPPITRNTTISMRRPPNQDWTLERFLELNAISEEMRDFLVAITEAEANIIVYGGTGSGKTSMLNALINLKDGQHKRLGSIEDTPELRPDASKLPNYLQMTTNAARDAKALVKNSLRQRFDYLLVGETRDATALDLLMAFSSGTLGSASTVHADGPIEALRRLVILSRFSSDAPPDDVVRTIAASAIHLVIWTRRYSDNTRHIARIDEIMPELDKKGEFQVRNVFTCIPTHAEGNARTVYHFERNPEYIMSDRLIELFHAAKVDVTRWSEKAEKVYEQHELERLAVEIKG